MVERYIPWINHEHGNLAHIKFLVKGEFGLQLVSTRLESTPQIIEVKHPLIMVHYWGGRPGIDYNQELGSLARAIDQLRNNGLNKTTGIIVTTTESNFNHWEDTLRKTGANELVNLHYSPDIWGDLRKAINTYIEPEFRKQ